MFLSSQGSLDMWGSTMGYIKAVGSHLSRRRRPWQATKDPAEQLATLMFLVPQFTGEKMAFERMPSG